MKIEVFEASCCKPTNVYGLVERAMSENGIRAEVTKSVDVMEAVKRGIMRTPAIIVDGKVVYTGRIPEYEEVVGWLTGGK
ncbi:MAG: redox-active disulfide protein 2 [Firmicutes bacterium]|nr:redox-active disulfide protein 2 [Bacillota bacterium]